MKTSVSAFAMAVLGIAACAAQAPAGDAAGQQKPGDCVAAATNVIAADTPCIFPDRRVMLRLEAPGAQRVQALIGGGGAQTPMMDMAKQPDGAWTLTTPPIVEGFHYYHFYVDGVEMEDPGSHTFFGEMRESSGIEIPSPRAADDFYQVHDVPHGEVR